MVIWTHGSTKYLEPVPMGQDVFPVSTSNKHEMNRPKQKIWFGSSRFKWLRRAGTTKLSTVHTVGQGPTLKWHQVGAKVASNSGGEEWMCRKWGHPSSLWHCQWQLSGEFDKVYPHKFPHYIPICGWFEPIKTNQLSPWNLVCTTQLVVWTALGFSVAVPAKR